MIIKIRLLGYLEEYLGSGIHHLELPFGSTMRKLFYALEENWSEKLNNIWDFEKKTFKTPFIIMVDGHDIQNLDYLLSEGCLVTIIPPIVGG